MHPVTKMKSTLRTLFVVGFLVSLTCTTQLELKDLDSSGRRNTFLYTYVEEPMDWVEAFRLCRDFNGQLASPINPVLDDDLRAFSVGDNITESFWIGARATTERGYHWETYNLEVQYSNYGVDPGCNSDAIDDNCLVAIPNHDGDEWHWCGISCFERKQFVCEFSTEPTTTTTPGPSSSSSTTVTSTVTSTPTSTVPSTSTTTTMSTTSSTTTPTTTTTNNPITLPTTTLTTTTTMEPSHEPTITTTATSTSSPEPTITTTSTPTTKHDDSSGCHLKPCFVFQLVVVILFMIMKP